MNNIPPPPTVRAPHGRRPAFADKLWNEIDAGKRAWAIRESVRLHASTGADLGTVFRDAEALIVYVETAAVPAPDRKEAP